MAIKNLPNDLIGKTLMQISDIHIGETVDSDYIIASFKKAKALNPDFVVYTGDFITYSSDAQYEQLASVFDYVVLGKIGTIGILGNHDYGKNWEHSEIADRVEGILKDKGVNVLRNEIREISGLNFIGLDDFWGTNYEPEEVMKEIDFRQANIVLCHNPDVADEPIWDNYEGWILSGHTHGGQCKPPFLNPPLLPVENSIYSAGRFDLAGGRNLYINRALGHLWQVRFNVRPEITVFRLGLDSG